MLHGLCHRGAISCGNQEGRRLFIVPQVRPTPTRFPTNSLYTPVDKHTLAFYIKCVPPVGRGAVVVVRHIAKS